MSQRPLRADGSVQLSIRGVTKDYLNIPRGGCTLHLFRTADDVEVAETTSDNDGSYSFPIAAADAHQHYYVVAYLPGTPDISGTTVNTLSPS
jgi:hypothetical protein